MKKCSWLMRYGPLVQSVTKLFCSVYIKMLSEKKLNNQNALTVVCYLNFIIIWDIFEMAKYCKSNYWIGIFHIWHWYRTIFHQGIYCLFEILTTNVIMFNVILSLTDWTSKSLDISLHLIQYFSWISTHMKMQLKNNTLVTKCTDINHKYELKKHKQITSRL